MAKKIIGSILIALGTVGTLLFAPDWYRTVVGTLEMLDADGKLLGPVYYAVPTLIAVAVAIVGIVLLVMGIKKGKKDK